MNSLHLLQWLTLGTEAVLVATLLLVLFRLRRYLGLTPLYITLGVFQPIQVLLASSIYNEILPGVMVSPGSVILFPASLFAVLLIYIREDALESRKAIYGIMLANLTMSALIILLGWQMDQPDTINILNLPTAIFHQNARVMLAGSIALFIDVILIILVYEALFKWLARWLLLRIFLTLAGVLAFDSLFFYTAAFYGLPDYSNILLSGLLGKTIFAIIFSLILYVFLRRLPADTLERTDISEPIRDIFNTLTYRQKYELERKQSRKALDEKEALFRALSEQSGEGIGIASTDGNYIMVNSALCKMTGYSQDELLTMNLRDLLLPEEEIKQFTAVSKNHPERHEVELVKKNGLRFMVEISAYSITQDGKQLVVGLVRDVTEQHRMEQELRESEHQFRQLAENIPEVFFLSDPQKSKMIYISPAYEKVWGRSCESLYDDARSFLDAILPEDRPIVLESFKKQAAGQPVELDYRITRPDGQLCYIHSRAFPVFDEQGRLSRLAGIAEDFTSRIQAEEQIRTSEANLKSLLDNREDYIWSLDREYRYIAFNRTYAEMFFNHYKEPLRQGLSALEFVSKEENDFWTGMFERAFNDETVTFEYTYDLGKGLRHFQTSINPIRKGENITGASAISVDITETVKVGNRFRALFEQAPVPLWEEDFSGVKKIIDSLKKRRVKNFRKYFDTHPAVLNECIQAVKIIEVNKHALDLHEASSKEELIEGLPKIFTKDSEKAFKEELVAIAENRSSCEFDAMVKTLKGNQKSIYLKWTVVPGYEDSLERIYISTQDITDRKMAEQTLRESEEKFRLAFKTSPDSVNITRLSDGKIVDVNEAFTKVTGYSKEEALGKKTSDLNLWADPKDREIMADALRTNGFIYNFEFRRRMKDGSIGFTILSAARMQIQNEPHLLSIIRDIDEQKKASDRLLAASREWQTTFDSMDSAVWILDGEQKIIRSNQAAERLFSQNPAEIIGKNCWQIVHGTDQPIEESPVVRARESLHRESMDLLQDNRWLEITVDPILDEQGNYAGAVHIVTDITERKQHEDEIIHSQARLQILHDLDSAILESQKVMDICTVALRQFGRLISNQRSSISVFDAQQEQARVYSLGLLEEEIGQARQVPVADAFLDLEGLKAGRVIRIDDFTKLELDGVLARLKDSGVQSVLNIPIRTHDTLLGSLNIGYNQPSGFTEEHIAIGREVADSVAIALQQADLRESLQQQARALEIRVNELQQIYQLSQRLGGIEDLRQLADEAIELIFSALRPDQVLFYLYRDEKLELLAVRTTLAKLKNEEFKGHGAGECLCRLAIQQSEPVFSVNILKDLRCTRDECKNAGLHSFAGLPLMAADRAIGVIGLGMKHERHFESQRYFLETLINATAVGLRNTLLLEELRSHEAELEDHVARRTADLVEANRELESFSYSVSHDLRAPLRAINGFTRILLTDYVDKLDQEAKRLGAIIQSNAKQMGQLIDDLLAFSRLGRTELHASDVDMKSQVKTVFEELTTAAERKRIHLSLGALPKVSADVSLMRQVWTNLLSNAIKFSGRRQKAEIKVKAETTKTELVFRISDNGAGFDMTYKDKLFGVFQRLHSEAEFEGTGVGLALIQRIIQRHGGRVWAQGQVDKGATFSFSLPIQEKK